LQEFPAFFPKNSRSHLHPVIEPGVFQQRIKGGNGAPLGIFSPEYQATHPRLENGPRAHDARFESHIQSAAGEPIIFDPRRPFAKGKNLCVSRRIGQGDGAVSTAPDDFSAQDQNRPDGYFPFFPGHPGLFKGNPHELRVFAVQRPKIDGRLSVFLPGGGITWRKGTLWVMNPFEKIHFLYITFQPFVKAPGNCGFRIADFGIYSCFSLNPQSAIANPQFINFLADPPVFC
jgi:hypothetical protein